jgi:[acyl-carrier-protein] S-malonyltransferase
MATAGRKKEGAMAAVIGLKAEETETVCSHFPGIWVVNYNCPGQQVISGEAGQIPQAAKVLQEAGARRVIPLAVSGAFHSPLMSEAARIFSHYLEQFSFQNPCSPIIGNASGEYALDASGIRANVSLQMDHPVLWEKSMRQLLADDFKVFIEVGPGTVLQGLMKRIDRRATVLGVNGSPESLERVNQVAVPD